MQKITLLVLLALSCTCLKAQSNLDSLFTIWQDETQKDSIRTDAYKGYLWDGFLYSNPDSAFILAEALISFAKKEQYLPAEAEAFNLQGLSFWIKGSYPQALGYLKRSLKIYEEHGNKKGVANSLCGIGIIYQSLGNDPQALDYNKRSLKIHEEIGYKKGMANTLTNIGIISVNQGNYPQALEYYQRSLKIYKEIRDKSGIANTLNNIGIISVNQGNYPQALEYYQRSLKIYKEIRDKSGIANTLNNIGIIYNSQDRYAAAIKECQKSLSLSEEIGAIDLQKDACSCLYEANKGLGKGNKALQYHEQMVVLEDSLNAIETIKKLQQMEFQKQVLLDSIANAEKELLVQLAHEEEMRAEEKTRNISFAIGGFFVLLAGGFYSRWSYVKKSKATLQVEKDRSENLLLNILPEEIAQELKEKGKADARDFDMVSIIFTDFKGFTQASAKLGAQDLVAEINTCFEAFDNIVEKYGIEKIKTIGDAYMAAGGLPLPSDDSVKNTVLAALEMQAFISSRKTEMDAVDKPAFEMRAGIHTGPVVAGIVGVKKFQYDIWGDTVNTASRMESSGEVGEVNISEATYELLKQDADFTFQSRGKVAAKGKGEIEMYFVAKS